MKTLIFGDSITEGNSDIEFGGWANRLRFYGLQKTGERFVNLGVGGDEVVDILKRFDCMTKSYIDKYKKNPTFIFAVGINDSVKYSLEEFEKNLVLLIEKAKKYNPNKIIFIGLTNVDESKVNPFSGSYTGKCYKNERIKLFDEVIQKLAKQNNFLYIELFGLLENKDFEDGLHPNSQGHQKIFGKFLDYLG